MHKKRRNQFNFAYSGRCGRESEAVNSSPLEGKGDSGKKWIEVDRSGCCRIFFNGGNLTVSGNSRLIRPFCPPADAPFFILYGEESCGKSPPVFRGISQTHQVAGHLVT